MLARWLESREGRGDAVTRNQKMSLVLVSPATRNSHSRFPICDLHFDALITKLPPILPFLHTLAEFIDGSRLSVLFNFSELHPTVDYLEVTISTLACFSVDWSSG